MGKVTLSNSFDTLWISGSWSRLYELLQLRARGSLFRALRAGSRQGIPVSFVLEMEQAQRWRSALFHEQGSGGLFCAHGFVVYRSVPGSKAGLSVCLQPADPALLAFDMAVTLAKPHPPVRALGTIAAADVKRSRPRGESLVPRRRRYQFSGIIGCVRDPSWPMAEWTKIRVVMA